MVKRATSNINCDHPCVAITFVNFFHVANMYLSVIYVTPISLQSSYSRDPHKNRVCELEDASLRDYANSVEVTTATDAVPKTSSANRSKAELIPI